VVGYSKIKCKTLKSIPVFRFRTKPSRYRMKLSLVSVCTTMSMAILINNQFNSRPSDSLGFRESGIEFHQPLQAASTCLHVTQHGDRVNL
jgi:hypothetical protein